MKPLTARPPASPEKPASRLRRSPLLHGIAGQITAIIIVALCLTFLGSVAFYWATDQPEPGITPMSLTARVAALAQAAEVLRAQGSDLPPTDLANGRVTILPAGSVDAESSGSDNRMVEMMRARLRAEIGDADRPVTVSVPDDPEPGPRVPVTLTVQLSRGDWLRFVGYEELRPRGPRSTGRLVTMVGFLVLTIGLITIWATRRVTAPLSRLVAAADQLGREGATPLLREEGPAEIRLAAHAFNLMQERIRRFLDDRTKMLAAISHDLRTPLTRLRLRLEGVSEAGLRAKMLDDLASMDAMVGSALAFLRGGEEREKVERVDIAALLQTLCDEFSDTDQPAFYEGVAHLAYDCRALSLSRALTNLIGNAVKFGGAARVDLHELEGEIVLRVEDDGPGLAADQLDRVFEPFYRADAARNPAAGGVGLGLSIARSVIHSHGGEIVLSNRAPHGLCATVTLPKPLAGQIPAMMLRSAL